MVPTWCWRGAGVVLAWCWRGADVVLTWLPGTLSARRTSCCKISMVGAGTRRGPLNFILMGANSIAFGSSHVRCTTMRRTTRVVSLTKSRKIPTRKILPLSPVGRATFSIVLGVNEVVTVSTVLTSKGGADASGVDRGIAPISNSTDWPSSMMVVRAHHPLGSFVCQIVVVVVVVVAEVVVVVVVMVVVVVVCTGQGGKGTVFCVHGHTRPRSLTGCARGRPRVHHAPHKCADRALAVCADHTLWHQADLTGASSGSPLIDRVLAMDQQGVWEAAPSRDPALGTTMQQVDAIELAARPHPFGSRLPRLIKIRPLDRFGLFCCVLCCFTATSCWRGADAVLTWC